ncbi:MAG: WD40/YVTN/BNR-like repeat-containing protein [Candidatus Methylomirabilota bacterium]
MRSGQGTHSQPCFSIRGAMNRPRWSRLVVFTAIGTLVALTLATLGETAGPSQDIGHLHALLLSPTDETLWIGTHYGLYRSNDLGKTWEPVKIPANLAAMDFMSFAQDPNTPKVMYVGTHNRGILKTSDGGVTWAQVLGIGNTDVHALAVDSFNPAQPKRWYAWIVEKGLFRSLGDLDEWKRQDDGPVNPDVRSLQSVNIPTGMGGIWLYAGTADGLYRSPDCF